MKVFVIIGAVAVLAAVWLIGFAFGLSCKTMNTLDVLRKKGWTIEMPREDRHG